MNIAIDNDEILFDLHGPLILFHNQFYGTELKKENFFSYKFHEVWGGTIEEEARKILEFFDSEYFQNIQPTEGSQKAMKFLKDIGHTLFVVTGRIHSLTEKTISDIDKYFPNIFSGVCFANTYGATGTKTKKSILCRKLNTQLIIEDDLFHVNDCANNGISVLVHDYPWNREDLPKNAIRFFDWKEAINLINRHSRKTYSYGENVF
jgi:uncharacterized HAD superfamily protein